MTEQHGYFVCVYPPEYPADRPDWLWRRGEHWEYWSLVDWSWHQLDEWLHRGRDRGRGGVER